MRVAVISDVHCGGLACPRAASFVSWLDTLEADRLWMLGDIFHFGWVFGGRLQPEYQPVFEALDRASARGLKMVFVPGNHDFRLGPVMAERYSCEVRGPHIREVDGVRFHLSHGDEADSGFGYRLLGGFLRGRIAEGAMRLIGLRVGTALLRWLAGKPEPEQSEVWPDTLQTLRDKLTDSEVAIMGHAHVPWRHEEPHGLGVILGPGVPGALWVEDGVLRTPAD